jgi:hypothetical protein
MINQPTVIVESSFQSAWVAAARLLAKNNWGLRNLVVQISDPRQLEPVLHEQVCQFAASAKVLGPKAVAYTIFPHNLYRKQGTAKNLFTAYNRPDGFFDHVQSMVPHQWGTYFRRMTNYKTTGDPVNQLDEIITAIRSDARVFKGAFCIVIQVPGGETKRRRGGPCLNYIAVQRAEGKSAELGLLAVYRSHDFLERAYGNYWGLCNLLNFMAKETKSQPGPLTCVSSVAYVPGQKRKLEKFLGTLP